MIDIAVVGGGAIAQRGYLPAIERLQDAKLRWVVDVDEARARRTAAAFDATGYATDHREVLDDADAAIITTPPKFHGEIAGECLRSDVHVLTEKPVALTRRTASELVSLADQRDLHYAVSRQYREAPAYKLLRTLSSGGRLGTVRDFEVRFGDRTNWGFASDYRLRRSLSGGGGALTDKGTHVLDIVRSLFDGSCEVDRYQDDSFGGLEANAEVELTFRPWGVSGTLEISGSRDIDDEIVITGDRGRVVADPGSASATLHDFETGAEIRLEIPAEPETTYLRRVGTQAERFVESIRTGDVSYVRASTAVDVLAIIEECYESRELLAKPWETVGVDDGTGVDGASDAETDAAAASSDTDDSRGVAGASEVGAAPEGS